MIGKAVVHLEHTRQLVTLDVALNEHDRNGCPYPGQEYEVLAVAVTSKRQISPARSANLVKSRTHWC
ncbi:hypothetical protein D3C76_1869530 [compost metagenome]